MAEPGAKVVPLKTRRCPMCGRPAVADSTPFCSLRCTDLDLGRWLNDDYRIATCRNRTRGRVRTNQTRMRSENILPAPPSAARGRPGQG